MDEKRIKELIVFTFAFLLNLFCSLLLIVATAFLVKSVLKFEFTDITVPDVAVSLVIGIVLVLIFGCLLCIKLSVKRVYFTKEYSESLLKRYNVFTIRTISVSLTLVVLGNFYPTIPSISHYEKPYKEALKQALKHQVFPQALAAQDAGNFEYIKNNFIDNSFRQGDMVFKIYPNDSLRQNINLRDQGDYTPFLLENKFWFKDNLIDWPRSEFGASTPNYNCNNGCSPFPASDPYSISWEYEVPQDVSVLYFSSTVEVSKDVCFSIETSYLKDGIILDRNSSPSIECFNAKGTFDKAIGKGIVNYNGAILSFHIENPIPSSKMIIKVKPTAYTEDGSEWLINNGFIRADESGKGKVTPYPCIEGYHLANPDYILHMEDYSSYGIKEGSCK